MCLHFLYVLCVIVLVCVFFVREILLFVCAFGCCFVVFSCVCVLCFCCVRVFVLCMLFIYVVAVFMFLFVFAVGVLIVLKRVLSCACFFFLSALVFLISLRA